MNELNDNNAYTVSVVIPAYNSGSHLTRAVDSVLSQTHKPDEIIIVDDGSSDDTADIAKGYETKVTYIYQNNAGASAARNKGIQSASSKWIAFLDADDQWLPENLDLQIQLLKRNPHLAWSTANYIRCLCNENRTAVDLDADKCLRLLDGKEYFDSYFAALITGVTGNTDTMIIKRDVLIDAGMFRVGQKRFNDMDTWWRIAYREPKIGFVCRPMAIYHLNIEDSISQKNRSADIYRDLIRRHIKLADEHNKLDEFRLCAAHVLQGWIRSMLFDGRKDDIRSLINEFDELFMPCYKIFIKILTAFPKTTALCCHTISRIVRTLRLRRHLVRKPK